MMKMCDFESEHLKLDGPKFEFICSNIVLLFDKIEDK